ncbi:hypothetical protein [Rhizobium sp. Leaf321]|nr:hypothetical protein [Rhizobium sp. Leaf321]
MSGGAVGLAETTPVDGSGMVFVLSRDSAENLERRSKAFSAVELRS